MSRVLILKEKIPFVQDESDAVIKTALMEFRRAGHEVDLVELPVQSETADRARNYLWRSFDLTEFGGLPVDVVVLTSLSQLGVRHPCKVAWLLSASSVLPETQWVDFNRRFAASTAIVSATGASTNLSLEVLAPPPAGDARWSEVVSNLIGSR